VCCSIIQCALQSIDVSLQQLRGFVDTRVLQSVAVRVALNMCTSSTGSHHCGRTCVAVSCSVLQCVLHLICIPFRQLRGNTDTVPTAPSNRCSIPHTNCAGTCVAVCCSVLHCVAMCFAFDVHTSSTVARHCGHTSDCTIQSL